MIRRLSYVCSPFYIPQYICLNGAYFSLEYCGLGPKAECVSLSSPIYTSQNQCFLALDLSAYQTRSLIIFGMNPFCHLQLSENLAMIGLWYAYLVITLSDPIC